MEIRVKIITGNSFFSGGSPVTGVALASDCDTIALTRLADSLGKHGRPCTVMNTRPDSAERLTRKWEEWAAENGHTMVWAPSEAVEGGF